MNYSEIWFNIKDDGFLVECFQPLEHIWQCLGMVVIVSTWEDEVNICYEYPMTWKLRMHLTIP